MEYGKQLREFSLSVPKNVSQDQILTDLTTRPNLSLENNFDDILLARDFSV